MEITPGMTAFITGGAQGIGLGIARALARRGVNLAIADIDGAALAAAVAELSRTVRTEGLELDVRDRAAFAEVADTAEDRLGPVSILVNNAGVGIGVLMPITQEIDHGTWDFVMGVNLEGVNNGVTAFVPRMATRRTPAHIVNTASAAGLAVFPERTSGYTYHASKYAVVGMTEALRRGFADEEIPIGASVLIPGMVATNVGANSRNAAAAAGLRGAEEPGVAALAEAGDAALARYGHDIGAVGELVADGITADRLYLPTDRLAAAALTARTEAIIAAMPTASADHDDALSTAMAARRAED